MLNWNKKEKPLPSLIGMGGGAGGFAFGGGSGELGSESNPFTSIAGAYSAGVTDGLYYFQNANVNSGNAFQLRYASYDGRGWVETLYSKDSATSTPWDHWLDYQGGSRPVMVNYNQSNYGLNYSSGSSSFTKLHSSFNLVDFAVTSKSSVTGDGLTATGQNQGSALPLIASNDLAGTNTSGARLALAAYFGGYGQGFSCGGTQEDYDAHWSKNGGPYEIHLGFRETSQSLDEWQLADGNNTSGATYAPNIGYRISAQSYSGANVGSWSSNSVGKGGTYLVGSSNVLSCWVSDAL